MLWLNPIRSYVLNLWYWVSIILLHRPFIPFGAGIIWQDDTVTAHWICSYAADRVCDLALEYRERFGLRVISGNIVYTLFTAAIMHLANSRNPAPKVAINGKHRFEQVRWDL